jgi:hypothetical protein
MSIFDHPGFMWYGGRGTSTIFEVLHADWPVYPAGHGWELALQSLSLFPPDIRFVELSEIDQCFLLIARGAGKNFTQQNGDDLFHEKWFHVAVWRKDLTELHRRGFLTDTSLITEYKAALSYYNKYKNMGIEVNGEFRSLNLRCPQPSDFEDNRPSVLVISPKGLMLSPEAYTAALSLARPVEHLYPAIAERVGPVLKIPLYDTAVREASLILETTLRHSTGKTDTYGDVLVDDYYRYLLSLSGGKSTAFFKTLRSELKTLFKFVRNDFAHRLKDITEIQCRSLLDRISQALEAMHPDVQ